jgi:hypothetical protein
MEQRDNYTEIYNAKWMNFQEVAHRFIPTRHYFTLLRAENSVICGCRGSGKTTLLKMLSRCAQDVWINRQEDPSMQKMPARPQFEAIYIPFNVYWNIESASIDYSQEMFQRILVSLKMTISFMETLIDLKGADNRALDSQIASHLIHGLELKGVIPSVTSIGNRLGELVDIIVSEMHDGASTDKIHDMYLPRRFSSGPLAVLKQCCLLAGEALEENGLPIRRWAFCIDDLEYAPEWLVREIYQEMKNASDKYILKTTSMPLLPSVVNGPEPYQDFTPITLWDLSQSEAYDFCEKLSSDHFALEMQSDVSIKDCLGHSEIYSENAKEYTAGSNYHELLLEYARRDHVFRTRLRNMSIDPDSIDIEDQDKKQKLYKKIRQVLYFRKEYERTNGKKRKHRSRRILTNTLYGLEVLYRISEANPRWLLSLINQLVEVLTIRDQGQSASMRLSPIEQARVFMRFSTGFMQMLASISCITGEYRTDEQEIRRRIYEYIESDDRSECEMQDDNLHSNNEDRISLRREILRKLARGIAISYRPEREPISVKEGIDFIGHYFMDEIHGEHIEINPVMSFVIDPDIRNTDLIAIRTAFMKGAIVQVGGGKTGIFSKGMFGNRYRLSYRLCPQYHLPMRVYREKNVSAIRVASTGDRQLRLGYGEDEQ